MGSYGEPTQGSHPGKTTDNPPSAKTGKCGRRPGAGPGGRRTGRGRFRAAPRRGGSCRRQDSDEGADAPPV
ncbi:hypothetical protein YT1_2176 [Rhodococcus ruber]|nr:hypothetical protein YT1_2176 [Rhodococcus ruber]